MLSRRARTHIGLVTVIVLCILPLVPWLMMKPLELRFGSFVMWMTSIGQVTALVGFAMFAVSLILIARIKVLEPYFGGLDRIFQAHRHLGMLGFLLMLIHPLALAAAYVPVSVISALQFLTPSINYPQKAFGIVSLLFMMLLLGATIFAQWRYQVLLKTHKVLGIAFLLGTVHALFIPSDISNNTFLTIYFGTLGFLAIGAYLYRTLFAGAIPTHHFIVQKVQVLDKTTTEVTLDPVGKPLVFSPGQFVFVSFKDGGINPEVHPFTISSAPHERTLRLTVKALGDWTSELPCLAVGSHAEIEGPFGGFTEDSVTKSAEVWVAGGIGITPFLSRARHLAHTGVKRPVDLYYATNTRDELLFIRELEDIARKHPKLRVIPHVSKEDGYLTATVMHQMSGPIAEKDVFVCGPPGMMKSISCQCKDLGLRPSQMHMEEFSMI